MSASNPGARWRMIPRTTRCIHTKHASVSAKKSIQVVVQMPVSSSMYPNTIGHTKPPSPPITPTMPPTTPTSFGK
jgi:hypothetical protein